MEVKRSKKIVLTSFCILNQNAVISGWERAEGAFSFVKKIIEKDIGIMQLPCPEVITKGMARGPLNYEDYDTPIHRKNCQESLMPTYRQIEEFIKEGYDIIGIIGIYNSPNCSITGKQGVFMEEFLSECRKRKWEFPNIEVPDYTTESEFTVFTRRLDKFLEGECKDCESK